MSEPNLDKQIQYILNSLIRKRSISDNYDGIENATLDIQDIIANQVREAYKKGYIDGGVAVINDPDTYTPTKLNKEATQ